MGESFLGLPNRFKIIDNLLESTYNPNHALSAYQGYLLRVGMENYVKRSGGSLTGDLSVRNIIPNESEAYTLGTDGSRFDKVYAKTFYGDVEGNSDTASALKTPINIKVTGSVIGTVTDIDGSADITIDVTTNHKHDDTYLPLTGGTLSGPIKMTKNASIINQFERIALHTTSDEILRIGYGSYSENKGATELYSAGDLSVITQSAGLTVNSKLFNKTVNLGSSSDSVYMSNTETNSYLELLDDGTLQYNRNEVYHHGNFKPEDLLYTDYKKHVNDVKKVVKVIAILLDQLEVSTGAKTELTYPEASITDQLSYYRDNAMKILDDY